MQYREIRSFQIQKLKVISDSCFEGYQSVTEVILPKSLEVLCMEKSIKNNIYHDIINNPQHYMSFPDLGKAK